MSVWQVFGLGVEVNDGYGRLKNRLYENIQIDRAVPFAKVVIVQIPGGVVLARGELRQVYLRNVGRVLEHVLGHRAEYASLDDVLVNN